MPGIASQGDPPRGADLPVETATLYPEDDGFLGRRAKAARAKLLAGDLRGRAGDVKNEVALERIRGAGRSLLGRWLIRLADGSKLAFVSMRGADRKRLEALLAERDGPASADPALVHLCPSCLQPVPGPVGATLTCPNPVCRIPFRDPRRAARLSALVPGLGDLYLRHHLFGAIEFLGSMAMLGVGAAIAADLAVHPEPSTLAGGAALLLLLLLALPRVVDHRLTVHMGRKGLVPLALSPAPGAQARNLPSYARWSPLLFAAGVALTTGIVAIVSKDLRYDVAINDATRLAGQRRFDDALALWRDLERAGNANEERRVRLALALLEAGDVEDADELRASFESTPVEGWLAARWNAALQRDQAASREYSEGIARLVKGEADEAWPHLDNALAYFRGVSRPHVPASRGEVHAHLAMELLSEPLSDRDVAAAWRWLEGTTGAPEGEIAVVRAAYQSATGDAAAARSALAALDPDALPARFRLLALEARARAAEGDDERAAVRRAAEAFPRTALEDDDGARLEALAAPQR